MSRLPLSNPPVEVLIGLGGNLGDPLSAMREALVKINNHQDCAVVAVSSLWRTPPWGLTDQPDFLNACARLTTRLTPRQFLDLCLAIEHDLKRVRDVRWGPRSIDIDVLFFGDQTINEPGLIVPHPRIVERAFVLVPLAEIAPETTLNTHSISALASVCVQQGMSILKTKSWFKNKPEK